LDHKLQLQLQQSQDYNDDRDTLEILIMTMRIEHQKNWQMLMDYRIAIANCQTII
jgi:hypothetical protein